MFSRFVFVKRMRIKLAFPEDKKGRHQRITHTPHTPHAPSTTHFTHAIHATHHTTTTHTDSHRHPTTQTPTPTHPHPIIDSYSCRLSACVRIHITLTFKALHSNHIALTPSVSITKKNGAKDDASFTCDQQFAGSRELKFHDTVSAKNSNTIQ